MKIRRFRSDDADVIWRLHTKALQAANADAGDGPWDDDLRDIESFYLRAGGEFLIGELRSRIVAMGALARISAQTAEVRRMRVAPTYQRRGHGQRILDALHAAAAAMGFARLVLDTTVGQHAAQSLYRANDYREVSRAQKGPFLVLRFERAVQQSLRSDAATRHRTS